MDRHFYLKRKQGGVFLHCSKLFRYYEHVFSGPNCPNMLQERIKRKGILIIVFLLYFLVILLSCVFTKVFRYYIYIHLQINTSNTSSVLHTLDIIKNNNHCRITCLTVQTNTADIFLCTSLGTQSTISNDTYLVTYT